MAGYENFMPTGDDNVMGGAVSGSDKVIQKWDKGTRQILKIFEQVEKISAKIAKNMESATGNKTKSGLSNSLGDMPSFGLSRQAKIAGGVAIGGATVVSIGMGMMPNTGAAVTQRLGADAVAGISGLNSRQVILRSNRAIGSGATSAMGPTMSAMALMYGGGYTATSQTFRNVMPQVGGLSALTGGTNEQMAQGLAGVNAMRFLRIGVQARDSKGNLKPPNQIINDTYRFLYSGRRITPEQAAMVLNPNSKGYATINAIAGGDQNLMGIIQMGIIARAKKEAPLTKKDLSGSDKALDLLGVGAESPMRTNFRYNTSEARKLQATEKGLVGGYNVAMRSTAAINDGFSSLAEQADLLTQAFAGLRGAMQTLPAAGNTGATIAGAGGMLAGGAMNIAQLMMLSKLYKGAGGGGVGGGSGGLGGPMVFGGKNIFGRGLSGLKFAPKSFGGALGRAGLGATAYMGMEGLQKVLNKANVPSWLRTGGNFMFDLLQGGVAGLLTAGPYGALAGAGAAGVGSVMNPYGRGGDDCSHGNIGPHSCGVGGDNASAGLSVPTADNGNNVLKSPVPAGTPITSGFGPRDNTKNPQISSYHRGLDYGVPVGTKIKSAADGVVTEVGTHRQYGNYVIVKHGKKSTIYAHLKQALVQKGQAVSGGEVIALSGGAKGMPGAGTSTGPHLHFEVRDPGGVGAQGREDPRGWFGKALGKVKGVISNVFKAVTGFLGFGKDKEGNESKRIVSDGGGLSFNSVANLSSLSTPAALAKSLSKFGPLSWSSYSKSYPGLQPLTDKVSGDSGRMVGGSRKGLINFLHNMGLKGDQLETAFAIALAESGGIPDQKNRHGDYGLFQINMAGDNKADRLKKEWNSNGKSFRLKDARELLNPTTNTKVMLHMTKRGNDWTRWETYKNRSFLKFLDDAHMAKEEAGIGGDNPAAGMAMETVNAPVGKAGSITGNITNNNNFTVHVDMKVAVDKMSSREVTKIASDLRQAIQTEFKVRGIGVN